MGTHTGGNEKLWVKPELVTQIELGEWDAGRSPETFSFRGVSYVRIKKRRTLYARDKVYSRRGGDEPT